MTNLMQKVLITPTESSDENTRSNIFMETGYRLDSG